MKVFKSLRLLSPQYSDKANKLFLFQKAHGSKGVTHLALSKDGNHMLGAA